MTAFAIIIHAQAVETAKLRQGRMDHQNYRTSKHMHWSGSCEGCCLKPADVVQAGVTLFEPCIHSYMRRLKIYHTLHS